MGDIVVIGGGVAGLATAFELLQRDPAARVTILEAADRAGGNIRTEKSDGYTVEWGPNGFLDNAPETLSLVDRLGISGRLQPASEAAKKRFIWRDGQLHEIQAHPAKFMGSGLLSMAAKLRLLAEPFTDTRPGRDETVFDFASRHMGEEAARILVDAMVSGVFGGSAYELSLQSAFPKMHAMDSQYGSLTRAMFGKMRDRQAGRLKNPSGGPSGPAGHLTSFIGGMSELIDGLVAAVRPDRIRLATPASWIAWDGPNRLRVRVKDGSELDAAAVVMAVPSWNAGPLADGLSPALSEAMREIPGAALSVVALGFEREGFPHPLDGFGFLVPRGEGLTILGSLWTSSVFPGRADDDHVLVRTMIGGAHHRELIDRTDDELLEIVTADLTSSIGELAPPTFQRIYRHSNGIPQYTVGHSRRVALADEVCGAREGLFVTGNSFRGIAVNSCIAEAGPLAERVLASVG